MLRSSLVSASAVILCCATAAGQQQLQAKKMPTAVKDAGIYHMATGTWTRNSGAKANVGLDIIFRSDVSSGYFGVGWEGSEGVDEGIVPGTGNPNKTGSAGPRDDYSVDGFDFGYCSLSTGAVVWDWVFYDGYVPCDIPSAPANCVNAAGGGSAATPGGGFCWLGTFDMTGSEVCFESDGGSCAPGYDGGGLGLDHQGWGATWTTTDGATTGPFLDGHDLTWTPEGEGTVYFTGFTNPCLAPVSSALGTEDFFAIHNGALTAGCYWFGGYVNNNGCGAASNGPGAQFHMKYFTDVTSDCDTGCDAAVFCDTNPDNQGDLAISGCDCSAGNITLTFSGSPVTDGNAGYVLIGLGTGSASPTGVSDLCLTGSSIGRYNKDIKVIAGGGFTVDILNSATSGSDVPTIGGPLCNGNTWRKQVWMRDGMNPSRFSKGVSATLN